MTIHTIKQSCHSDDELAQLWKLYHAADRVTDRWCCNTVGPIKLEPEELAMLRDSAAGRRLFRFPYDLNEYISLLIREDHARLNRQLARIQTQHSQKFWGYCAGGTFRVYLRR